MILATIFIASCQKGPKNNRIVFLGDSLIELGVEEDGYITLLKTIIDQNHKEKYELIGAGVGGDKIYDLYLRLDDVLKKGPGTVVVWIGINDVWQKSLRGTGTDNWKFERFYNAIVKKLKNNKIKPILVTPTMVGESLDLSDTIDKELNDFSEIVKRVADNNQCELIDMRKAFLEYLQANNTSNHDSGILTTDGVHLNKKGNELAAQNMYSALKKSILK